MLLDATQPNASYQWQDNSTAPTFFVSAPGTYSVRVTMNGCVNTGSVKVAYKNKPRFSLGNDTTLCSGLELILDPGIRNAAFQWQNGSTSPVFTVKEPGSYQLVATNECGSVQDQIVISKGVCELLMPTAFTPNGDGLNDLFRIKYPGFIKTFSMTLYNRWGEVIFRSSDPTKGWDGKYKGVPQPIGNYVWQIVLTTKDGLNQRATGTVMLIR
jgi:gliding motility-associated-like protein